MEGEPCRFVVLSTPGSLKDAQAPGEKGPPEFLGFRRLGFRVFLEGFADVRGLALGLRWLRV